MRIVERVCDLLTGKPDRTELANMIFIGVGVFIGSWTISGFGVSEAGNAFLGAIAGVAAVAVLYRLRRRRAQDRTEHEEA